MSFGDFHGSFPFSGKKPDLWLGPTMDGVSITRVGQRIRVPKRARFMCAYLISPGAGGGGGCGKAAGAAGGGGGGGAAGNRTFGMVATMSMSETIYVQVAAGGAGGAGGSSGSGSTPGVPSSTMILAVPFASAEGLNQILSASALNSGTGTGPGGGGTAAAAGAAGTGVNAWSHGGRGVVGMFLAIGTTATAGAAGGAQTGATGAARSFQSSASCCGGGGGAGCTTTEFAGGGITLVGMGQFQSTPGGVLGGGAGRDAGPYMDSLIGIGGAGGGSSNAVTGGRGGNGYLGGGGGGGGAGVTLGGAGGRGGDGACLIWWL